VALFVGGCAPSHKRVPYELTVGANVERFDSRTATFSRGTGRRLGTARVDLTEAEKDTLWDLLARSGYFEAPARVGKGAVLGVNTSIRIDVVTGSKKHTVTWTPTNPELTVKNVRGKRRTLDPQEKGLFAFFMSLHAMLERRETVRALPRLIGF